MQNYYLEILGLKPGASKHEIKSAYRRLSKKYHPDVSKDPQAKEQFIRITEAYKFLTDVGPRPHGERTRYNYDPKAQEFARRRAKARYQARQKARAAAKRYYQSAVRFTRIFSIPVAIMLGYNMLAAIDRVVPTIAIPDRVVGIRHIYDENDRVGSRQEYQHDYELINTHSYSLVVVHGQACNIEKGASVEVSLTPIFKHPEGVQINIGTQSVYYQAQDLPYEFYMFLIPLMLAMGIAYFWTNIQNMKISLAVLMVWVFFFQLLL